MQAARRLTPAADVLLVPHTIDAGRPQLQRLLVSDAEALRSAPPCCNCQPMLQVQLHPASSRNDDRMQLIQGQVQMCIRSDGVGLLQLSAFRL